MSCNYKKVVLISPSLLLQWQKSPQKVLSHVVFIKRPHVEIRKGEFSRMCFGLLGIQEIPPSQAPQEKLKSLVGLGFLNFRNVESHSGSSQYHYQLLHYVNFKILYPTCHCSFNFHLSPFWVIPCFSFYLLLVFGNSRPMPCHFHWQAMASVFLLYAFLLLLCSLTGQPFLFSWFQNFLSLHSDYPHCRYWAKLGSLLLLFPPVQFLDELPSLSPRLYSGHEIRIIQGITWPLMCSNMFYNKGLWAGSPSKGLWA